MHHSCIQECKRQLRRKLRLLLRDFLGTATAIQQQRQLQEQLYQEIQKVRPQNLLAYVPQYDEINIWPVLQRLQHNSNSYPCPSTPRLAFAQVSQAVPSNGSLLNFVPYPESQDLPPLHTLRKDAERGQLGPFWQKHPEWNLLEPSAKIPPLSPFQAAHSLVLCPGLAFYAVPEANGSARLLRLGRGKGFYDRILAQFSELRTAEKKYTKPQAADSFQAWGLGYTFQFCPELAQAVEQGLDQELDKIFLADQIYSKG